MRLLLVSHKYAPELSPRSFRWSAIAEQWARQGHAVDVVCSQVAGVPDQQCLNGVQVHRVGPRLVEGVRAQLRKRRGSRHWQSPAPGDDLEQGLRGRAGAGLLAFGKCLHDRTWKQVYWPDYACLWYPAALRAAKALVRMHRYDGLVTVSHPFTGHLVGLAVKGRYPGLRWVADMGDPFCFLEEAPPNNRKLFAPLNYAYDRKVVARAEAVAVTTERTATKYRSLVPASAARVCVIPPLLAPVEADPGEPRFFPQDGKIRLVFIGTLYKRIRDPDYLLRVFAQLLETRLSDRLELHFLGRVRDCKECFAPYRSLLDQKLFLQGEVPRERAWAAMKEAGVLVNIGNGTPYQLPSKVVEYASACKPVLNLLKSPEDSSGEFFGAFPASFPLIEGPASPDPDRLAALIEFLEHPPVVEAAFARQWVRPFALDEIAEAYRGLFAGRS